MAGIVTIQNTVDVTSAAIATGATVQWIGAPDQIRNFGNVTGDGTLIIQGGTNSLKGASLSNLKLLSGKLTTDSSLAFGTLNLAGGELSGKGSVKATSTSLVSVSITGITLTTTNLDTSGFTTLLTARLILTGAGKSSTSSQLTLNAGSVFQIAATGTFTQGTPFTVVPGADPLRPAIKNDGTWSSTSAATINVDVNGQGKWLFSQVSTLTANAVTFSIGSAAIAGYWKFVGVTSTIPAITGGGTLEVGGGVTTITSSGIGTLLHQSGKSTVVSGSVTNLNVSNGDFIVTGLNVGTFDFLSGNVQGIGGKSTINASTVNLFGEQSKFINNIAVIGIVINWNCLGGSCQVVANNAVLNTAPKKPLQQ